MKQKLTSIGLLVLSAQSMIAQDLGNVASTLQSSTASINTITNTIINWITIIFSAIALVRLIMIFTSQGSGEEKIAKSGTWIYMLVFTVIGFALAKILMKN